MVKTETLKLVFQSIVALWHVKRCYVNDCHVAIAFRICYYNKFSLEWCEQQCA